MSKKITFLVSIIGLGIVVGLTVFFIGQQVFGAISVKDDLNMTGSINMNSNKITGLPVPLDPNDAVRLVYLDSAEPEAKSGARAYLTADQNIYIPSGSPASYRVKVLFNAENYDIGGDFRADGVNSDFTAPSGGYYLVIVHLTFTNAVEGRSVATWVAGMRHYELPARSGRYIAEFSTIQKLTIGNSITVEMGLPPGTGINIDGGSSYSYLVIYKLGS